MYFQSFIKFFPQAHNFSVNILIKVQNFKVNLEKNILN